MAVASDCLVYARDLAQTDSNGIGDTVGLRMLNDGLQNFTRELIKRGIDAAQTQESYANLSASNPNTYAWPSDMFSLKTLEIDFTGGGGDNFIQAERVDVANLQGTTSFDWLRNNQSTEHPLFDNRGDTYEIFPVPAGAITSGIRLFYFLTPTEYTAISDTISYPQSLDFRCLASRVAAIYAQSLEKFDLALALNTEYKTRIEDIIKILAPGSQQPIKPQKLKIDGWQF